MNLTRYLAWRIAAARFGRSPLDLGPEERTVAATQAARERRVIRSALAAPEASAIEVESGVVEARVAALAAQHADVEAFRSELAAAGLDMSSLEEAIAAELRAGLILERIGGEAVVDESEVRAFYAQRRADMVLPERRVARHILVTIDEAREGGRRSQVAGRMTELMEALRAGDNFETLALRHSECPSALDGGRLGEVRRGQLYPEVESALFSIAVGEGCVVESPLGFHLIRCDVVIPAQPLDYAAAAPAIRRRLEATARDQRMRHWLQTYT